MPASDDAMRLVLSAQIPLAVRRRTRGLRPIYAGPDTFAELSICRKERQRDGKGSARITPVAQSPVGLQVRSKTAPDRLRD